MARIATKAATVTAAATVVAATPAVRAVPANAHKYGANHKAIATKAVMYGLTAHGAATAAAADAASSAAETSDGVMSAAERDALKISELADEPADAAIDAGPGRLTPLVKLLEALNAPLSFVPDALRDTLGKVAIVTLVNSIAVLIYVLFLRH